MDAFAREAVIAGPYASHEALTSLHHFVVAPRPTSGSRDTGERHAMGSNTITSSVLPSDQDIVGDMAPPQRGTEIRRPSANYEIPFAVSGDCSRGGVQIMALPREKTLWHARYEAVRGGTVHRREPQVGDRKQATVCSVMHWSRGEDTGKWPITSVDADL